MYEESFEADCSKYEPVKNTFPWYGCNVEELKNGEINEHGGQFAEVRRNSSMLERGLLFMLPPLPINV